MNRGRIEQRAAKVSLVTGLSTLLSVAFQLISVPVCLRYWGKEAYGGWLALFSAFMLLRSLDTGFVALVGNKLNLLYHKSVAQLREHLASAVAGIALISCMQLLLAGGALIFDPLARLLGFPAADTNSWAAKLGLVVLMLSWTLTGSYLGIVHRLLVPAGMMYQAAWWAMGFQIAQFASIMAAAMLRLNMLQTSLLFALSQLAIYVTSAFYVRHKLPHFSPWLHGVRLRTGLADLGQSLTLTASNLVQQAATNGVVLAVAAFAGPVAVPIFTTVRTLTNLWTSVTTVLTAPLLPEVVRIHAMGEVPKLVAINQAFWVTVGSLVNWGTLLVYPLLPYIYGRWTAHAVALDQPLLCFMLGSVVLTNAGALIALHLNGINSLGIILSASIVRAVSCLGVGVAGFGRLGLTSFGLGILLGELLATLMMSWYFVRRELRAKGSSLPAGSLGPVALSTSAVVLFFVCNGFGWWTSSLSWLLALSGLAVATGWGWRTLEPGIRARFMELPQRLYR